MTIYEVDHKVFKYNEIHDKNKLLASGSLE